MGVAPLTRQVRAVGDGEEVFGLRIVTTPGHTPGHISVLEPSASALIVGDAAFNLGGMLTGSPPQFTASLVQAGESLRKLAGMQFEQLRFAHGPAITSGGPAAIAQLLERYPRASDGQSLEHQSFETQSAFAAIHGAQAGAAWVREHEAALRRGHVQVEASPVACCPFELSSA
jgi:glyoxylase-like metal-dependent hydrolase (beta-lactamase superfamily II)